MQHLAEEAMNILHISLIYYQMIDLIPDVIANKLKRYELQVELLLYKAKYNYEDSNNLLWINAIQIIKNEINKLQKNEIIKY